MLVAFSHFIRFILFLFFILCFFCVCVWSRIQVIHVIRFGFSSVSLDFLFSDSIVTFLPKNLWEQFQRIANFYFLVMTVVAITIGMYIWNFVKIHGEIPIVLTRKKRLPNVVETHIFVSKNGNFVINAIIRHYADINHL